MIDTIYADTTGDTSKVIVFLDGYDLKTTPEVEESDDCATEYTAYPLLPEIDPCLADQMELALTNAYAAYDEQVETFMANFKEAYKAHCMQNLEETLTKDFTSAEYQYTLYYYDQAGNLTMTVPPAGVEMLDATGQTAMADYRLDPVGESPVFPSHSLTSEYRYNSLNQLSMQKTPDAGESRFWYDALGRIVLSQNAQQAEIDGSNKWKFSYTLYDGLGRIYEVGELKVEESIEDDVLDAIVDQTTLLAFIATGDRNQVTNTYYNEPLITAGSPFGADGQQNLRNRVTAVTIEQNGDGDKDVYDYGTHYSYDIHGNVNVLINENQLLGNDYSDQQFKRIDYTYDLISGNVLEVAYQDNQADQFYHQYNYDADNRIYEVHTSRDGYIWEREARYFYYRHGPLARTETGDMIVQGTDYAYTIQGWLKGVNAAALLEDRDMGKDGYVTTGNTNKFIAQDAFGFALYYFDDDYEQINTGGSYKWLPNLSSSNFTGAANSLYNGNIMAMSTALLRPLETGDADGKHDKSGVLGKIYQYDQLNRLVGSAGYEKSMTDATSFTWTGTSGATHNWGTKYGYDANGNILAMKRAGNSGTAYDMDDLSYGYYPNTNQLRFVKDDASGTYSGDIEDQYIIDSDPGTGGTQHDIYQYDKIGNLVKDIAEDISEIAWTVYGKIKFVKKNTANKLIEFDYDPMGNRVMKKVGPVTGSGTVTWTYYVRDAQGNIMATYTRVDDGDETLALTELHVYGSSRLGLIQTNIDVLASFTEETYFYRKLGEKRYELVNHLGNVLSVISDRRLAFQDGTSGDVLYYEADVIAAQDYDPFGMQLVGRKWALASEDYRFGFGGKEELEDLNNSGNYYDFEARLLDTRLGRWLSSDPLESNYASWSTYTYCQDNPLYLTDLTGMGPDEKQQVTAYTNPDIKVFEANVNTAQNQYNKTRESYINYYKSIGKITDQSSESDIEAVFSKANVDELNRLATSIQKNTTLLNEAKAKEAQWNKLDTEIEDVVDEFNTKRGLTGDKRLDPNLVKALMFSESEMGTSADYLILMDQVPAQNPKAVYQLNLGRVTDGNVYNSVVKEFGITVDWTTNYLAMGNKYDVMLAVGALMQKSDYAQKITSAHFKSGSPWFNAVVAYKGVSKQGAANAEKVWNLYLNGTHPYTTGIKLF